MGLKRLPLIEFIYIPTMGIRLDGTILGHFVRDLIIGAIFWVLFKVDGIALSVTVVSFSFLYESGQGTGFLPKDLKNYFDPLDFLPSIFAGVLLTSAVSWSFSLNVLLVTLGYGLSLLFFITLINILTDQIFRLPDGTYKKWSEILKL